MNTTLVNELYEQIDAMPIVDIHTHVNWKAPTARHIGDILSYHYYTELANSAAYRADPFPFHDPEQLTHDIVGNLHHIRHTVQYDWLMAISHEFLGIAPWEWTPDNADAIMARSVEVMGSDAWFKELTAQAGIERVYLTNQYDDDLEGLDSSFFTPCLRIEPFVLDILKAETRERMGAALGRPIATTSDVVALIDQTFRRFTAHGMGYAAISSPAGLCTYAVSDEDAQRILTRAIEGAALDAADHQTWAAYAMARIADACRVHRRPFHLMIGVNRDVYAHGVPAGTDLFDSVNSMRGYDWLLNAYPDVPFPTAVLADTTGLELVASAWIRHNVYPSGHWWYANQPTEIARELRRRLDTVPSTKLIGYFSDAYYLEFILPKFRMFKFELAAALAERMERSLIHPNMTSFSLDDALDLAYAMLVENPIQIVGPAL